MTEDFEKSTQVEPEAEFPSPFDEPGAPPLPEVVEMVAEEPIAPPPLPEAVIEEVVADVEAIAPPPLPEAYPETEVLGALSPKPEPEPAIPTARQPITFGPPPAAAAPPPVAPAPSVVDASPAELAEPKKSNQTLIIVLIVVGILLLLCCCCVTAIFVFRPVLDEIMYELGITLLTLL